MSQHHSISIALALVAVVVGRLSAAPPADPVERGQLIGAPISIDVEPRVIELKEPRASVQLVVTAKYADGSLRDLTALQLWKVVNPEVISVSPHGLVTGLNNGATDLQFRDGDNFLQRVAVVVSNASRPKPISFRREVMPVLSSAGCSDIRCHGAPSGKRGFRLSLWGADPLLDFQQLTRDGAGRRTNSFAPDKSLVLLKALSRVTHAGGRRFKPDSSFADLLRAWQAQGSRDDADSSALQSIEATPARRVLAAPARWQQLVVRATFADGHSEDVTGLTTFSSTDLAVANVDRGGLVEFHRQGEVAILCRFLGQMTSVRLIHIGQQPTDYQWPETQENNYIDTHVLAKLKLMRSPPSELCSDEHFVRRVFLDLCGVLPTPAETKAFLSDASPDRRGRLIDQLLERPEYADFWTKKWMDVLRVSRDSIQLAGAKAYQAWLRERIAKDVPLTDVVRELLVSAGESYKDPAVNFYCVTPTPKEVTDPIYLQKDLAEATAQLFLGVRLQCAQCHNHPFERWTQRDYLGLAAVFTQVKRSHLGKAGPSGRPDRRQMAIALDAAAAGIENASGETIEPSFLGVAAKITDAKQDRRLLFAKWLTKEDNPFFAKAVANRIWFHLHGRGIVEPVDDFRDSNPAANDPLLNALAADFVAQGFRLKPLVRTIVNSRTYQTASKPNEFNKTDVRYFSHARPRPLPAEVLLDAVCEVTGVPESYEVTEDYTVGVPAGTFKFPPGTRATQLPVTDIMTLINTSGKYVRYELHPFLRTFGQPNRTQTCECDREHSFGRKQALELIVGAVVSNKLAAADNRLSLLVGERPDAEVLDELYVRALCRPPSADAAKALLQHIAQSTDKRQAWEDVLWTILNSQEFIYQH